MGGGGDMPPPKSVWADAHDLELDLKLNPSKLLYASITKLYLLYTPSPCFNPFPHETMKP